MNNKNKKVILVSIVALLIVLSIGVTYAYFTAQISGGESISTISVSGGTMNIVYADHSSQTTFSNVYPKSEPVGTKSFTVSGNNTTDLDMYYSITLIVDNNEFSNDMISYKLVGTNAGSNGNVVNIDDYKTIQNGTSSEEIGTGNFTGVVANKVHTYTLNFYFLDNGLSTQNIEQGNSFAAHVTIDGTQAPVTEPKGWNTAASGTLMNSIKNSMTLSTPLTHIATEKSGANEKVLAEENDDYGISYYFRGSVENNYVVYANMCWRVVRVVGDGSIKLVLYNYNPNNVSNPCDTSQDGVTNAFARFSGTTYLTPYSEFSFNPTTYDYLEDVGYLGLMYGTFTPPTDCANTNVGDSYMQVCSNGSQSYANAMENNNKNILLRNLESWYSTKIGNNSSYSSKLADVIWCNDKNIVEGNGYGTYNSRTYSSRNLSTSSFICPTDNLNSDLGKYTVNDKTYGNGKLSYPIGLLTAQEVTHAGGLDDYFPVSSDYYLSKNATDSQWWTMTPYSFYSGDGGGVYVYLANKGIVSAYTYATSDGGLRPSVALKSNVTVTGNGTASSPYRV